MEGFSLEIMQPIYMKELRDTNALVLMGNALVESNIIFFTNKYDISGGSGTLVAFGDLRGILYAPHVPVEVSAFIYPLCVKREGVSDVFEKAEIKIIDKFILDNEDFERSDKWNSKKLDIGLLLIDPVDFNFILASSGKKPVDLLASFKKYKLNPELYVIKGNADDPISGIVGAPRENEEIIDANTRRLPFEGPYFGGAVLVPDAQYQTYVSNTGIVSDIVQLNIGPTEDKLPDSFGGMSGGGYCHIRLHNNKGIFEIDDFFLSGVFVAGEPGKYLICRGPKSLYGIFCEELYKQLFAY